MLRFPSPCPKHLIAIPIIAGVFSYALAFGNGFVMDDFLHIVGHRDVADRWHTPFALSGRGIAYWIWRALYFVFGYQAFAYHTANVILHLACGILVYFLAKRLSQKLGLWSECDQKVYSVIAATIFAIHPLGTEAVNYAAQLTTQLTTLLFVFFSLSAVLFLFSWMERNATWKLLGIFAATLLAAQSKEPGIFHVVICLFFAMMIHRAGRGSSKAGRLRFSLPQRIIAGVIGGTVLLSVGPFWAKKLNILLASGEGVSHILTQSRVFFSYLAKLVFPANLSADHYIPWSTGWGDTVAVVALLGVALLVLAILCLCWRGSLIACLCGPLVFQLLLRFGYRSTEVMVEYRAYPSLPWAALLGAWGLLLIYRHMKLPEFSIPLKPVVAGLAIFSVTLVNLQRSTVWSDDYSVLSDVLKKYPLNGRAHATRLIYLDTAGEREAVIAAHGESDEIFQKLLKWNESHPHRNYDPKKMAESYTKAKLTMATNLADVGRFAEALEMVDFQIFIHHPEGVPEDESAIYWQPFYTRARILMMMGESDLAQNDWDIAKKNLQKNFSRERIEAMNIHLVQLGEQNRSN